MNAPTASKNRLYFGDNLAILREYRTAQPPGSLLEKLKAQDARIAELALRIEALHHGAETR